MKTPKKLLRVHRTRCIHEGGKHAAGQTAGVVQLHQRLAATSQWASFYGSKYSLVLLLALFYVLSSGVLSVTCWVCLLVTTTAEVFQWLTVDVHLPKADASLSSAPSNLLFEIIFHGLPLLGLTAASSFVVIYHIMHWSENYGTIRVTESFHDLFKKPPELDHERSVSVRAPEEQLENLWKSAFVFLAALCSRMFRLRYKKAALSRKEVLSDGILRLLSAAFLFLVSSWAFYRFAQ